MKRAPVSGTVPHSVQLPQPQPRPLALALALAMAIAVSVWVGWTRYALLEPAPIAVLTAAEPVTVHGARFALVGVTMIPAAEDATPGAVTVRLSLTQAGGGEDLACVGWLVSGPDSWRNRYTTESSCRGQETGQARPLSFDWEVPAGTRPEEFQLRFGSERVAIRP